MTSETKPLAAQEFETWWDRASPFGSGDHDAGMRASRAAWLHQQAKIDELKETCINHAQIEQALQAKIDELEAKVAWLGGEGSITGWPWEARYMDGVEAGKSEYREKLNTLEDEHDELKRLARQDQAESDLYIAFPTESNMSAWMKADAALRAALGE